MSSDVCPECGTLDCDSLHLEHPPSRPLDLHVKCRAELATAQAEITEKVTVAVRAVEDAVQLEAELQALRAQVAALLAELQGRGYHHGTGRPDCPRHLHHHHDERCRCYDPPVPAEPLRVIQELCAAIDGMAPITFSGDNVGPIWDRVVGALEDAERLFGRV